MAGRDGFTERDQGESLGQAVYGDLRRRFLGEKLWEVGNNPEMVVLEAEGLISTDPGRAVKTLKETHIWKKRQELIQTRFGRGEAAKVTGFLTAFEEAGVADEMVEAAYEFGEERLRQLGVSEERVKRAVAGPGGHVREVVEAAEQGNASGFLRALAALHDVSKYAVIGGKDTFMLGMHETMSGVLTREVMATILSNNRIRDIVGSEGYGQGWENTMDLVARFAGIAVSAHGYEEFPYKMAVKDKRNILDQGQGIYKMFGTQFYLDNRSVVDNFCVRGVGGVAKGDRQYLVGLIEGLREADMAVGGEISSMWKYHEEAVMRMEREPKWQPLGRTSREYIMTFAATVLEYWSDMPNVLGLRGRLDTEADRSLLLLVAVERGEDPSFFEAEWKNSGISDNRQQEITRIVDEMRSVFPGGKGGFADHYRKFLELGRVINSIPQEVIGEMGQEWFDGLRGQLFMRTTKELSFGQRIWGR
ncbi:hypothetical protein A2899_00300 [Candidatus Amesbacteria bacterium RIFCSPLOWO2_01_FULL_49_25]|uniref:HD domain-containing protein n=1 Tax=Candidatus Amesbacteria bacterium RIFCSPHIGHO2_01_FULL_48_32b TaxID=1797253 RepID=A0A1F4YH45_9BACT|nr:MAG: hypothetical protein A2876_05045 [Candidatus Amesbacteria bacterium RIFCSPHIGHO2_01_FULL_48_32b]OGD07062.1 MAG: hypothetical protein A2899_00300 [Candidatus Amesbacteria bacterium RIFCSPLOWO2_01_FULL_49_25]